MSVVLAPVSIKSITWHQPERLTPYDINCWQKCAHWFVCYQYIFSSSISKPDIKVIHTAGTICFAQNVRWRRHKKTCSLITDPKNSTKNSGSSGFIIRQQWFSDSAKNNDQLTLPGSTERRCRCFAIGHFCCWYRPGLNSTQNFDSVSTRRRDGWLCEASEASAILRRTEKAAPASSLCPQLNSRPTTFGPRLPPILSPTTHLEEMHVRRRVAPWPLQAIFRIHFPQMEDRFLGI